MTIAWMTYNKWLDHKRRYLGKFFKVDVVVKSKYGKCPRYPRKAPIAITNQPMIKAMPPTGVR